MQPVPTPNWAHQTEDPAWHEQRQEVASSSATCCGCRMATIAKVTGIFFLVAALIVTTAALCMHYPSASDICYALFGTLAGLSLITFVVTAVRACCAQTARSTTI